MSWIDWRTEGDFAVVVLGKHAFANVWYVTTEARDVVAEVGYCGYWPSDAGFQHFGRRALLRKIERGPDAALERHLTRWRRPWFVAAR